MITLFGNPQCKQGAPGDERYDDYCQYYFGCHFFPPATDGIIALCPELKRQFYRVKEDGIPAFD